MIKHYFGTTICIITYAVVWHHIKRGIRKNAMSLKGGNEVLLVVVVPCVLFISWFADADPVYSAEGISHLIDKSRRSSDDIHERLLKFGIGYPEIVASSGVRGPALRLQRVCRKLIEGQDVEVVIFGGSTSCNAGVEREEQGYPFQLKSLLTEFASTMALTEFNNVNSSSRGSRIKFINACVSATGSEFFKHCYSQHTSPATDLVILETSINDHFHSGCRDLLGNDCDAGINGDIEDLVRNVLKVSRWTAVLALNLFCPLHDGGRLNGGDVYHLLSIYYDMPVVILKNALLTKARVKETLNGYGYSQFFAKDDIHPNEKGHEVAALLLFYSILEIYQTTLRSAGMDLQRGCFTMLNSTGATEERCYFEDDFSKYEMKRRRFLPEQVMNDIGITKRYSLGEHYKASQCQMVAEPSEEEEHKKGRLIALMERNWSFQMRRSRYNRKKYYYAAREANASISFTLQSTFKKCRVLLYYLRSHYTSGVAKCYVHLPNTESQIVIPPTLIDSYMASAGGVGHLKQLNGILPEKGEYVLKCDNMDSGNREFRIIGVVLTS